MTAVLGAGRPQGVGDTYLLAAFASVFIGASSLRPGVESLSGKTESADIRFTQLRR